MRNSSINGACAACCAITCSAIRTCPACSSRACGISVPNCCVALAPPLTSGAASSTCPTLLAPTRNIGSVSISANSRFASGTLAAVSTPPATAGNMFPLCVAIWSAVPAPPVVRIDINVSSTTSPPSSLPNRCANISFTSAALPYSVFNDFNCASKSLDVLPSSTACPTRISISRRKSSRNAFCTLGVNGESS